MTLEIYLTYRPNQQNRVYGFVDFFSKSQWDWVFMERPIVVIDAEGGLSRELSVFGTTHPLFHKKIVACDLTLGMITPYNPFVIKGGIYSKQLVHRIAGGFGRLFAGKNPILPPLFEYIAQIVTISNLEPGPKIGVPVFHILLSKMWPKLITEGPNPNIIEDNELLSANLLSALNDSHNLSAEDVSFLMKQALAPLLEEPFNSILGHPAPLSDTKNMIMTQRLFLVDSGVKHDWAGYQYGSKIIPVNKSSALVFSEIVLCDYWANAMEIYHRTFQRLPILYLVNSEQIPAFLPWPEVFESLDNMDGHFFIFTENREGMSKTFDSMVEGKAWTRYPYDRLSKLIDGERGYSPLKAIEAYSIPLMEAQRITTAWTEIIRNMPF